MQYMGGITKDAIIDYICDSYSIGNEGGILILEETIHDYSMAKISSIIEQEGAKIFGVFVTPVEGQVEKLWISLKLNSLVLNNVISSLERQGLNVVAQINKDFDQNIAKERYESFMTFLNV